MEGLQAFRLKDRKWNAGQSSPPWPAKMDDWKENKGRVPVAAQGKRVKVELFSGQRPPESWTADGRQGADWTISKIAKPYQIKLYKIE